jgi:hypothetical protein
MKDTELLRLCEDKEGLKQELDANQRMQLIGKIGEAKKRAAEAPGSSGVFTNPNGDPERKQVMGRGNGNGDGPREPVEEVREKDLKFQCPRCGGDSLKLVGRAHVRLLITDDLSYVSTLEDSVPESERTFRCWDCDFLIADENGPVRRTWSLARWLRENCPQADEEPLDIENERRD